MELEDVNRFFVYQLDSINYSIYTYTTSEEIEEINGDLIK